MPNVFAVPVFFVVFRETLEAGIIVSVLLAFLKQSLGGPDEDPRIYKTLARQVWIGALVGLFFCLVVGAAFIGAFYAAGKNAWDGAEILWEGIFCVLASIIITVCLLPLPAGSVELTSPLRAQVMGAAILRLSKIKAKWQAKITSAIEEKNTKSVGSLSKKYAMVILPFITVLREGLEAVVFVGGVSIAEPASAFPLPVITALLAGSLLSFLIYKGGNSMKIQWFLIASTMLLYLVAAGLFSRGVWDFEMHKFKKLVGGDVGETGTGSGSYDIRNSVWHVNCCSAGTGGWSIFTAILGWQNSATYGSVISYNVYWIVVSICFLVMLFREKKGRYPFMKAPLSPPSPDRDSETASGGVTNVVIGSEKTGVKTGVV